MYPQGARMGLRAVVPATRRTVPLFSSRLGEIRGEPHVPSGDHGSKPNLIKARLLRVFVCSQAAHSILASTEAAGHVCSRRSLRPLNFKVQY
jgi:hypothetical protein